MDPITDRDIKRLDDYIWTIAFLYYVALTLPILIPAFYASNLWSKVKDPKNKYDERMFAAT